MSKLLEVSQRMLACLEARKNVETLSILHFDLRKACEEEYVLKEQRDSLVESLKEIHCLMYTVSVIAKQAVEKISDEQV